MFIDGDEIVARSRRCARPAASRTAQHDAGTSAPAAGLLSRLRALRSTAPSRIAGRLACPSILISDAPSARMADSRRSISQAPAVSILPMPERSTSKRLDRLVAFRIVAHRRDRPARPGASSSCRKARSDGRRPRSTSSTRGSRSAVGVRLRLRPVAALVNMPNVLTRRAGRCHFAASAGALLAESNNHERVSFRSLPNDFRSPAPSPSRAARRPRPK